MRAGKLDRPIVIEQQGTTQDALGQEIPTWTTFHTTYAQWQPVMGNERFRAGGLHSVEVGKFTFRYKDGILPTMRVIFDGKYYRITGIAEIPRRRGTELAVELWA